MLVVADTSPLNYLVLIGCIDILPQLHRKVLIPSAVRRELLSVSAPPEVRAWTINLPDWAEEVDPSPEFLNDPQLTGLRETSPSGKDFSSLELLAFSIRPLIAN